MRLTAAHLDAPRVDIRTVPLYEDNGMAFFKTHYYGGIKKYQWTAIRLELRGVVCVCENGEVKRVQVRVGDKPTDPKFVITDLLPHLATEQMTRKATEVIKGEGLNMSSSARFRVKPWTKSAARRSNSQLWSTLTASTVHDRSGFPVCRAVLCSGVQCPRYRL